MHPDQIKELILAGMACEYLELDGDGQHFLAIVVSREFEGKNRVQRQQRVSSPAKSRFLERRTPHCRFCAPRC